MSMLDNAVRTHLELLAKELENHLDIAIGSYIGPIDPSCLKLFRDLIEKVKLSNPDKNKLGLIVKTPGGSAEAVEKMVEIMRHHFVEVFFIVPEMAMSAGTILCMSGDKIFMDYASSLGPIDPQVKGKEEQCVPALGYLDQYEHMLDKSRNGTLTAAEFALIQNIDLAQLLRFEQARDLSITLLKEWWAKYKFKDWETHRTNPHKKGRTVTVNEKQSRAEEIARQLGDHRLWHSHGRMISLATLQSVLRLEIDDYSDDHNLKNKIESYYGLLLDYVTRHQIVVFCHGREFF